MWFPKPYLPKGQFGWKLKNRQRFARWYWNPMFKVHNFCAKWITRKGVCAARKIVAFRFWMLRMDVKDYLYEKFNKKGAKGGE